MINTNNVDMIEESCIFVRQTSMLRKTMIETVDMALDFNAMLVPFGSGNARFYGRCIT